MFERYNEKARRVIFVAREASSEFGHNRIEADFILLGIAREDPAITVRWLDANYADLNDSMARLYKTNKRIPTSVD